MIESSIACLHSLNNNLKEKLWIVGKEAVKCGKLIGGSHVEWRSLRCTTSNGSRSYILL